MNILMKIKSQFILIYINIWVLKLEKIKNIVTKQISGKFILLLMVNYSIVYRIVYRILRSIGCILFELITLEKYFNNQSFFYLENTTEDLNELLKMLFF